MWLVCVSCLLNIGRVSESVRLEIGAVIDLSILILWATSGGDAERIMIVCVMRCSRATIIILHVPRKPQTSSQIPQELIDTSWPFPSLDPLD